MAEGASNPRGYNSVSRLLHWLTALLVIATIPAGMTMVQEGLSRPVQDTLYIFHKNVGVLILLIVLARLATRAASPPPPLPASVPSWQRRVAAVSHALLYALLLVMAVSGYVRVRAGGFPVEALDALGVPPMVPRSESLEDAAQTVHAVTRFFLVSLILVHVGAATQHALLRRDGVFQRMWPPVRS
jgi:cytochrome b561